MKSSTPKSSLWSTEEAQRIFGDGVLPELNVRAEKMLSHWNNFDYKATLNNKQQGREFIKRKGLREDKAQIRGKVIGFKDKKVMAEFILKSKNV
tara:strand:- start:2966 stop:3247 length:282 start_codon:yes stop_codon:yes gene_type:complete